MSNIYEPLRRGFIYEDVYCDLIVVYRDGRVQVRDEHDTAKEGGTFDSVTQFLEYQETDFLETELIEGVFGLIKGEKYMDEKGFVIHCMSDGKICYKGEQYDDFDDFEYDVTYFDSVQLLQHSDETEGKEDGEDTCLRNEAHKVHPKFVRCVSPTEDLEDIHKNVHYTFDRWEDSTENLEWLQEHQHKMVCILSVSLAKPDQSDNGIDDSRRTMCLKALQTWMEHGWSVLLFVPVENIKQYTHCARLKDRFGESLHFVPYKIDEGTCNLVRNVGESRNAILHFVLKHKEIVKTCTVADERVAPIQRPKPVLSNCGYWPTDEPDGIKSLRIKEGYDRLFAVKQFMEFGERSRTLFETLQEASVQSWEAFAENDQKYLKTVVDLYNEDTPKKSVWHAMKNKEPSLVGLPTVVRWNARKTHYDALAPHKRKYQKWHKRKYQKWDTTPDWNFLGADVDPFAPDRLVMPTQLITFKVGQGGYEGQFFYPFTTIGEDNFFSYMWGQTMGGVAQLDAIQIVREFPRGRHTSITRLPDNLDTYTDCAIEELIYLIKSPTYHQTRDAIPTLKWTPDAKAQSLSTTYYKWQCFIFSQLVVEAKKRGIRISKKAKRFCNRLLEFILSDKFRTKEYFTDVQKASYNAMMQLYRDSPTLRRKIRQLGLSIPENR